jgi:hypothetical protein
MHDWSVKKMTKQELIQAAKEIHNNCRNAGEIYSRERCKECPFFVDSCVFFDDTQAYGQDAFTPCAWKVNKLEG